MEIIQATGNIIVLIGAVALAIGYVFDLCGRPIKFFNKRHNDAKNAVEKQILTNITQIHEENKAQSAMLERLNQSTKHLLRVQILAIYDKNFTNKTLTKADKDLLEDLYSDYAKQGGNSYVKWRYDAMQSWQVI